MANIHHEEFKDTERVEFDIGTSGQSDGEFGLLKVALRPSKNQFHGKLTVSGADPHYNGTYDVSGNHFLFPYQSATPEAEITIILEPGQNIRRFSGVMLVDDQEA